MIVPNSLFPANLPFAKRGGRFFSESKGSDSANIIENEDKQDEPVVYELDLDSDGIQDYVKQFVLALLPELNEEYDPWVVKQIVQEVVKEMKHLSEEEWRMMANGVIPSL